MKSNENGKRKNYRIWNRRYDVKKNDFFIYPEIQSFESALIFSRNFKNLVAFPSRMYFLWAGGKKIY